MLTALLQLIVIFSRISSCVQIQQHSFNCPYQAGSPKLHPHSNNANDAEVYELDLKSHDLVVMATDGVLDNLWDEDLQDIISAFDQVCSCS